MSTPGKLAAFHIGAHKTGTSLLQHCMRENAATLRRHRVNYVTRAEMDSYIGWGAPLIADPQPLADRVAELVRSPRFDFLIGSHENTLGPPFETRGGDGSLYPRARRNFEALRGAAGTCPTRVCLSIRPQHEFLESYYLQTIHQGRHWTFPEWLKIVDLEAVSWRPLVTVLNDVFGAENVDILDFRLIKQGQEAYVRRFLTGVDPRLDFDIHYDTARNRSISDKGLKMALGSNRYLRTGEERKMLRRFLQTHFSNVDYPRPVLFTDDQRATLQARYGAEYDELVSPPAATRTSKTSGR